MTYHHILRKAPTRALFAVALVVLFAQTGSRAATALDRLSYSKGYLVTGNYAVGSVDLTEQLNPPDLNGLSTGTIHINACPASPPFFNCVPVDADVVAAYLYWETITPTADLSQASGVKFLDEEILLNDVMGVKKSHQPLLGNTATCWSSGTPLSMTEFRADVLRFLPFRLDKDDKPTPKRLVAGADFTVTLPTRNGNQIPESGGASLVVVYVDPSQPLRKIVFYDGIHVQESLQDEMKQTLRGFYKSSATKSAMVTHIIASGQPNNNERVFFDDGTKTQVFNGGTNTQVSPPNPIAGASASQRAWAALTYDVSNWMHPPDPETTMTGYGDIATTTVDHSPGGGYDCLTWGAVIFSTAVADVDHDGLPDGLEDATSGLKDPPTPSFPDGQPLPNLNLMFASSAHRDLFVEVNAMRTLETKRHGSPSAPYPGSTGPLFRKDVPAHTHMPTPEVLKMLGDRYVEHGIQPHFDVGDWADYKALGRVVHPEWVDDYRSGVADGYLVPSNLARGGEVVDERACSSTSPTCQFPAFPGTVSWKVGVQLYRDAPVGDNGEEVTLVDPTDPDYFDWNSGAQRRRFDRNRKGLFHYTLYAHARGKPRSEFPCLVSGVPGPYDRNSGTSCATDNPQFHVPSSASGVADLPGSTAMVTLGFWDEFLGSPYVRAATTFHEIGHNLNLWHGGQPAAWGNKTLSTATFIEPNCKPNYLSVMSYLFQVHGLFDESDNIHLDFSGTGHNTISETAALRDDPLSPGAAYRPAWYAPASSALASSLGVSAATRFCNGGKFKTGEPLTAMARVYADVPTASIDWKGDALTTTVAALRQDVNFDGSVNASLQGFDDWANVRLDQISAGRNSVKFQDEDLVDFGSGDFVDFGSGDFVDFGSGDFVDFGSGDLVDFGSGAFLNQDSGDFVDFGSGDFVDFGSGDLVDFGSGDLIDFASAQELDFEAAKALGRSAPHGLEKCIIGRDTGCSAAEPYDPLYHKIEVRWHPPLFGHVLRYHVSRKRGTATSGNPYVALAPTTSLLRFADGELPNGLEFTYRTRAEFDDPSAFSAFSRPVTERAVNDAPVANPDSYTTRRNRAVNLPVLGNDRDVDSAATSLRAVLVSGSGPSNGTLSLNANGSFTYTPRGGFTGVDRFRYVANNGFWSLDPSVPMSGNSNEAEVTITVAP